MTLKQLQAEIKRAKASLQNAMRNDKEMQELRGFSSYGKEIDYFTKRVETLEAQLPEAHRQEREKLLKQIAAKQIKDKASTIGYLVKGNDLLGVTPNGVKWFAEHNWYGHTDRTRHCYTLYIGGALQFTSGTIDTILCAVASK